MEQNQNTESDAGLENLEAPVQELTDAETAQVDGGYIGSANGGVWKVSNSPQQPQTMQIKLENPIIVNY